MKPVEEMTEAEIADERAAIALERARLAEDRIAQNVKALAPVEDAPAEAEEVPEEDGPKPQPWPYDYGQLKGHIIEVRAPAPAALVAISMTGSAELASTTQMMVFSTFMTKHISAKSLDLVLGLMADPDSGVEMQDVIAALTDRVQIPE